MYLSSLTFDRWKSLQGTLQLVPAGSAPDRCRVTHLVGPSASGKTAVQQGIAFALGAGVPGVGRADQPGKLLDLVRGADRGSVEAVCCDVPAHGSLTIRRALRATKSGASQEFRCSPGPVASTRNEDHEACARAILGDFPIMIDPLRLPSMEEVDQRAEILRLCGGLQGIDVARVLEAIRDLLPELTDDEIDGLELDDALLADGADPLAALDGITDAAHAAELAREKEAKKARAAAKATPPDRPSADAIFALRTVLAAAEKEADRLRESKGALQERQKIAAEQRDAEQQAEQARREARAALEAEIAQLEQRVATPLLPIEAARSKQDLARDFPIYVRLQELQGELAATDWTGVQEAAVEAARIAAEAAKQANTARQQRAYSFGQVQPLEQQAAALAPGSCPTCGQPCTKQHAAKQTALAQAQAQLRQAETELQPLVVAEQQAKATAEQARQSCDAANVRHRTLQAQIAKLQPAVQQEQQRHNAALQAQAASAATLQAKREQLAALPVPTTIEHFVDLPAALDVQLAEVISSLTTAEQSEADARAAVDAWQAADQAALDAAKEIARAAEEAKRCTARRDLQRRLQDVCHQIAEKILGDAVGPFERAMRRHLAGEDGQPDPSVGAFVADLSRGGCKLGFVRDDPETGESYLVRLRRGVASNGEIVLFSLALAAALVELRQPPFKIALLDSSSDMDPGIQAGLLEGAAALVQQGTFDQIVIVGHYPAPGLDYESAGISLIDITTAFQATAEAQAQVA